MEKRKNQCSDLRSPGCISKQGSTPDSNTLQLLLKIVNPNVSWNKLNLAVIVVLAGRDSTVASQTLNGTWGTPLGSTVLLAIMRNPCGVTASRR